MVVPELPEEPNKPVLPNTVSVSVTYHKNFVSVEKTTEKPKPQVPTTPTEPKSVKLVTPTSVPVKEEAPALPSTGEKSTAASAAAGAAMVTSALALFGISTYKRKH